MSGASEKYAHFKMGNDRVNVPVTHIHGYSKNNTKLIKNQEYQVFWSNDDESPEEFLKREKKKIFIKDLEKQQQKNISGWYPATFLLVKDSEDELEKCLVSKRIPIPTEKVLPPSKRLKVSDDASDGCKKKPRDVAIEKQKGKKGNIALLKENAKKLQSGPLDKYAINTETINLCESEATMEEEAEKTVETVSRKNKDNKKRKTVAPKSIKQTDADTTQKTKRKKLDEKNIMGVKNSKEETVDSESRETDSDTGSKETTPKSKIKSKGVNRKSGNSEKSNDSETPPKSKVISKGVNKESGNSEKSSDSETTPKSKVISKGGNRKSGNREKSSDSETTPKSKVITKGVNRESGNSEKSSDSETTPKRKVITKGVNSRVGQKNNLFEIGYGSGQNSCVMGLL